MKTFLRKFCPCVSLCVISTAILIGMFALLQKLIETGFIVFQILAVLFLVFLALACVVGVVLLLQAKREKP